MTTLPVLNRANMQKSYSFLTWTEDTLVASTLALTKAKENSVLLNQPLFYLAIPVGGALGYIIGGFMDHHYGWRAAFFVA